jgi:hypothetical protein
VQAAAGLLAQGEKLAAPCVPLVRWRTDPHRDHHHPKYARSHWDGRNTPPTATNPPNLPNNRPTTHPINYQTTSIAPRIVRIVQVAAGLLAQCEKLGLLAPGGQIAPGEAKPDALHDGAHACVRSG